MLDALIVIHLLLLTYWLGGDLGVFYSSRYVMKPELDVASRTTALKIMGFLDMAPRCAMVLFLPSGVSLMAASPHGAKFLTAWLVALTWLFALGWLSLVIASYKLEHSPAVVAVRKVDLALRCALVIGLSIGGLYTLFAHDPFGVVTNPKWLGGKVLCYAGTIACGIAIRFRLAGFGPAYGDLLTQGSTPEIESRLSGAIRGSEPFVALIWVLVVSAATLGVFKPGYIR